MFTDCEYCCIWIKEKFLDWQLPWRAPCWMTYCSDRHQCVGCALVNNLCRLCLPCLFANTCLYACSSLVGCPGYPHPSLPFSSRTRRSCMSCNTCVYTELYIFLALINLNAFHSMLSRILVWLSISASPIIKLLFYMRWLKSANVLHSYRMLQMLIKY
jgi:hypothetical protein